MNLVGLTLETAMVDFAHAVQAGSQQFLLQLILPHEHLIGSDSDYFDYLLSILATTKFDVTLQCHKSIRK